MKQSLFSLLILLISISIKAQVPNTISSADKVYGLSKLWSEVNYNFVYLNKIDRKKWDSAYKALIPVVQQSANDYEYYSELEKFCALLKDGHTNILYPKGMPEQFNSMFGEYRLFTTNIDGRAIIIRTNRSKKNEIPLGSEIIEVNGEPTQQYINEKVAPSISSSTDYVKEDIAIRYLLAGLEGDTYKVKIKKPSGDIITLTLTHKKTTEKEVYPDFEPDRGLLDFKWLDNGIAYLALNAFDDPKIDTLFIQKLPELYKAKGLIIDLRYNGGGNSNIGFNILQYLTNDKFLYGSRCRTRMNLSTYKAYGDNVTPADTVHDAEAAKEFLVYHDDYFYNFPYSPEKVQMKAKKIVVPTVILVSHFTASAAEDFLIYADNQKHMVRIGERSFGSTGQPMFIDLPGGGGARICTKEDTYPDGRQFVGCGVKPDIEVKPTVNDYIQNKDVVLEKAIENLKGRIK